MYLVMLTVQSWSQVAAGTSFVKETLAAFSVPTSKSTLLVDMAGYDTFVNLAALEAGFGSRLWNSGLFLESVYNR